MVWKLISNGPTSRWWLTAVLSRLVGIELSVILVWIRFSPGLGILWDSAVSSFMQVCSTSFFKFRQSVTIFALIILAQWEGVALIDVAKLLSNVLQFLVVVHVRRLRHHPVHSAHCLLDELDLIGIVGRSFSHRCPVWLIDHEAPRSGILHSFLFRIIWIFLLW